MKIGGLEKMTLIDFPGEIAAIVFTQGCNFRCQFCYNPMLVWPILQDSELKYPSIDGKSGDHSSIDESGLFAYLESRKGKLDGVVITGGEPTLHPDLPEFIEKIREMGFKIKLDSNGTNPEMLKKIFSRKLVDYVAMDIKAPIDRYQEIVNVKVNKEDIKESIDIIINSGVPYEFRTTLVPGLASVEDVEKMGELISGANKWYLQAFKSDVDLMNKDLQGGRAFSPTEISAMQVIGQKYVQECIVR